MSEPAGHEPSATFTCLGARSAGLLALVVGLCALETGVLHVLIYRHFPILAYVLSAASLSLIVWLVADYRALGREAVRLDPDRLHLTVGRRVRAELPRDRIAAASAPSWLDLRPEAPRYLNLTKPATPNVLLVFHEPQSLELLGTLRRTADRLALYLDEPEAFLGALGGELPAPDPPRD